MTNVEKIGLPLSASGKTYCIKIKLADAFLCFPALSFPLSYSRRCRSSWRRRMSATVCASIGLSHNKLYR
jgi:hypothetical protein